MLLYNDNISPSPYKDILEKNKNNNLTGNQLVHLANKEFDKIVKNKDQK